MDYITVSSTQKIVAYFFLCLISKSFYGIVGIYVPTWQWF